MVQQTDIPERESELPKAQMLGHVLTALARLEQSIDELAGLLNKDYIVPEKRAEVEELLSQRKSSRMYLRKTLLQLGGIEYMIPYWRM